MNLAVDIGNTSVKLGLFEGEQLMEVHSGTDGLTSVLSKNKVQHAILSITGSGSEVEKQLLEQKIPVMYLSSGLKLPLEILYKTPQTLGSDRIAGSVAAKSLYPENPVLKIDFGTCITYDIVNEKSQYLGGAISPGMQMRFKALNHYTQKLPLIQTDAKDSPELTGSDTESSIQSGVIQGILHETSGIINEYRVRYKELKVVATGGDSSFFVPLLKSEIFTRPQLVLEGLNRILNYNL